MRVTNSGTNKEVAYAAVQQSGQALQHVSHELQRDRKIVLAAVKNYGWALKDASEELKNDKEFVLAAIVQTGMRLDYATLKLRSDKEIVLAAVKRHGEALKYASEELQNDPEIVYAAVKQNSDALQFASKELKKDREFILAAVVRGGQALQFANWTLQNDKEVVMAAVVQNGRALQFASPALKKDPEIVLTAVQEDPVALQYADSSVLRDKEFILIIVQSQIQDLGKFKFRVEPSTSMDTESSISGSSRLTLRSKDESGIENAELHERLKASEELVAAQAHQIQLLQHKSAESSLSFSTPKLDFSVTNAQTQSNRVQHPIDEDQELQLLQDGRRIYEQYIAQHHDQLHLRDWIAHYDNDPSTLKVFRSYDQVAQYCRGHKVRFSIQYYGPQVREDRIYPVIETDFGNPATQHAAFSYVEARIHNPEDETLYRDVEFMIDTGATTCMGRREILRLDLGLPPESGGPAVGLGGRVDLIHVQARISLKDLDGSYLPPVFCLIGYQYPQPAEVSTEDWLLGQNFLGLCNHSWQGHNRVVIQYPL